MLRLVWREVGASFLCQAFLFQEREVVEVSSRFS